MRFLCLYLFWHSLIAFPLTIPFSLQSIQTFPFCSRSFLSLIEIVWKISVSRLKTSSATYLNQIHWKGESENVFIPIAHHSQLPIYSIALSRFDFSKWDNSNSETACNLFFYFVHLHDVCSMQRGVLIFCPFFVPQIQCIGGSSSSMDNWWGPLWDPPEAPPHGIEFFQDTQYKSQPQHTDDTHTCEHYP